MRSLTYRKYLTIGMDLYGDFEQAKQYANLVTSVRAKSTHLSHASFIEVRHLHREHKIPIEELALEYNVPIEEIYHALHKTGRYKEY